MDNYEDKSDFEINKAVAFAIQSIKRDYLLFIFDDIDQKIRLKIDYQDSLPFDPCNNPSDAWPIITENRIDTGWAFEDKWSAMITNQGQAGPFRRIMHHDTNPLRAAMIVFLKMEQSK